MIECDGDSIDLSGDVGAVGRIVISNSPNGNQDLLLDLKGTNKSISLVSFMYYVIWFLTRQGIFTNKGFEINVRVILLHANYSKYFTHLIIIFTYILTGTIYKSTIVPSRTFCVVSYIQT